MGWAADMARAAVDAFQGAFDGDVAEAGVAIDEAGAASRLSDESGTESRFEIGSVTKTMTATLLALLVGDGLVGLDDEIGQWLAAGPNEGITLVELATHTSGLPRLASSQVSGETDPTNPYAHLTADVAEADLRRAVRQPGQGFVYSNFGYQLLGLVLERVSGTSYQALLEERLLIPQSMTRSGVGSAGGGTRIFGHAARRTVRPWDFPLPGAGGVETTADDLARYLRLCSSPPDTALGAAARLTQTPRVRVNKQVQIGLSWLI